MGEAIGIIVTLLTGAGLMYLYLQTSGKLRREEYEQELQRQITRLKGVEREYINVLKQKQKEEAKWKPKDGVVSDKRLSDLISKSLADVNFKDNKEK